MRLTAALGAFCAVSFATFSASIAAEMRGVTARRSDARQITNRVSRRG